jgi:hypothetical protein
MLNILLTLLLMCMILISLGISWYRYVYTDRVVYFTSEHDVPQVLDRDSYIHQ